MPLSLIEGFAHASQCDQLQPKCSRCSRRGHVCVLQTFKSVKFPLANTAGPSKRLAQSPKPSEWHSRRRIAQRLTVHPGIRNTWRPSLTPNGLLRNQCPESPRRETASLASNHESAHPQPEAEDPLVMQQGHAEDSPETQQGHAEDSPETQQADTGDLVCPSPTPVESGETMPCLSDYSNGGYGVFEAPFDTYSPPPYSASPSAATTLSTFSVAMPDLQSRVDIQFLWHHFVQHTAKGFLVWDPQTVFRDQDIQDPYAVGLPAMATSSLPLYYAALALSAFHYSSSTGDNTLSNLQKMFEQRAIRALSNPPSYTPPGPQHYLHTVTCIILLCVSSPGEYTDLLPLARSAAACLMTDTSRVRLDQDQRSVAMMLIRWCEVCVLCSPKLDAKLSEEPIHRLMECTVEEVDISASGAFRNWIIHPLYGFSRRLVKPLLKVARLVRARQNEEISPGGYPGLEAEIDALELELLEARDADIAALSASQQDDGNLLHLNEAVYSAAVIIFYTRMRDMPWTSPLIRRHVQTACSELSHLDLQSPISRAVIFPYYFAGCEAVGSSTRETIRKQISHLPDTWFNRGSRILQCLQHVWAIRDEIPGAPWISWNRKVSSAYADCIPC